MRFLTTPLFENVHSFLRHISSKDDFVILGAARLRLVRSIFDNTFKHEI